MRGLVIRQPFAGLFAAGLKVNAAAETIEFRNRKTHIRGEVAIRASVGPPLSAAVWEREVEPFWTEQVCDLCMERGAILCLATLADCRPVTEADRRVPGCRDDLSGYAWVFTDLRALPEPVAYKPPRGARVWFTLPPDVEAEVLRQTAREGEGGTR